MSPRRANSAMTKTLDVIRDLFSNLLPPGIDDATLLQLKLDVIVADSLDKFDLILRLEKLHSIFLDEVQMATCQTIGDLARLVQTSDADQHPE